MNYPKHTSLACRAFLFAAACSVSLRAQTAPAASPSNPSTEDEEVVTLSPFEVSTDRDFGYAATSTLSGGRLATDLDKTASAISVITREFLDDLGATDLQSTLLWSTNSIASTETDVTPASGGNETSGVPSLAFGTNSLTIRGIRSATIALNYFPWSVQLDTYNTERLDISRGPNALVFGDASVGGILNVTTKRAKQRNFATLGYAYFSNGGEGRVTADVNRKITGNFAMRLNAVRERKEGWRDFTESERDAAFLSATWNPTKKLQIRVEGEIGEISGTTPVTYLRDNISSWDGVTVLNQGAAAPATTTGVAVAPAGFELFLAYPEAGFVSNALRYRTVGSERPIELGVPPNTVVNGTILVDQPAVLGSGRLYPIIPEYSYSNRAAARRYTADFDSISAFVEKQVGDDLFFELAGNYQWSQYYVYEPLSANRVFIDVTRTLPSGVTINGSNANPDYLKPFTSDGIRVRDVRNLSTEFRASAIYRLDTSWTKQRIGMLGSLRQAESANSLNRLVRINGTNPNLNDTSNQLFFRTPLDQRSLSSIDYEFGQVHTFANGVQAKHVNFGSANGASASDTQIYSMQVFAAGSWLESERISTLIGARRDFVNIDDFGARIFDPVTQALVRLDQSSDVNAAVTSPTAGIVVNVIPQISVFANTSKSYSPRTVVARTTTEEIAGVPIGTGYDLGVKFSFFKKRITGSFSYYQTEEENNSVSTLGITSQLQDISFAIGENISYANAGDVQTAKATGYELDLTANLTRDWALTLNAGLPEATLTDALPFTRKLMAQNRDRWIAAAATIGGTAPAAVATALSNLDLRLLAFEDGRPIQTVRDYTVNLFTRYRFSRGPLKGLLVGGGVNFYGKNYIGQFNDVATYSDGYELVSALVGYETKIWKQDVRFQLNVSNVFDDENFRYMNFNTSLQPLNYRLSDPREFRLSATVRF